MNLEKVDRWISLATNAGVLIGIGLLVVELKQNTELARAEIHTMRAIAKTDRQMNLANTGEIARISQTAFAAGFPDDPQALSALAPEDRFRFNIFLQGVKEAVANWHFQCQQELLDDELCKAGYESEVKSFLPILKGMNVGLQNMRPSFIADVRRIAEAANLPMPNEDGSW